MLLKMVVIKRLVLMLTIMTTIKYASWNRVTYMYTVHLELQMVRLWKFSVGITWESKCF